MNKLECLVPPLVVFFICLVMQVLLSLNVASFELNGLRILGLILTVTSSLVMLAGFLKFKKERTTPDPRTIDKASKLVDSGIYAWSRNPMYFGMLLCLICWSLAVGQVIALLVPLIFVFYITRFQIQPEERAMLQLFGSQYEQYQASVRRWFGRY